MHRDFQSRNIMIEAGKPYIIDFQGARLGPIQYDLASLLIDPYAGLPESVQLRLLDRCIDRLTSLGGVDRQRFLKGYRYAALSRNLQILGAFGFLSHIKGKPVFATYIPAATKSLIRHLSVFRDGEFPALLKMARSLPRKA
jgi:aminoglycoside/choline kinase family phosphotransferase